MRRPRYTLASLIRGTSVADPPLQPRRDGRVGDRRPASADRAGIDIRNVGESDGRAAVVMDSMEAAVTVLPVSVTFRERRGKLTKPPLPSYA